MTILGVIKLCTSSYTSTQRFLIYFNSLGRFGFWV